MLQSGDHRRRTQRERRAGQPHRQPVDASGVFRPFRIVGFPDEHTFTGSQVEIFEHYGISAQGLAQTALQLLNQAQRMI